jgi:ubiquinone/menaquinone biosynthesis C-methylase UbiE
MTSFTGLPWSLYIYWLLWNDQPSLFKQLYGLTWYRRLLESLVTDSACIPGQNLLEVGSGPGDLALFAATKQVRIYAIERSANMVKSARKTFHDKKSISLQRGDVTALPYAENTFDHVISASLVNVVQRPDLAMAEMNRVLSPTGILRFLVPNENMHKGNVSRYIQVNHITGFSAQALKVWSSKAKKMNLEQCQELLHQAGLQKQSIQERLAGMTYLVSGTKI